MDGDLLAEFVVMFHNSTKNYYNFVTNDLKAPLIDCLRFNAALEKLAQD